MKKTICIILTILFITNTVKSQSEKYTGAMKQFLTVLDSAKTGEDFQNVSNNFERIANAEKTQWLPYYYAAYSLVMKCYQEKDKKNIDPLMDKADTLLLRAESLSKDNSEITTLKAMATQCRMMVDWSRGRTLGPLTGQIIKLAETQLPKDNPRTIMFEAQSAYYTPEMFGGSKPKGKELMQKAIDLFTSFKPETELHPSWGKAHAEKTLENWVNKKE